MSSTIQDFYTLPGNWKLFWLGHDGFRLSNEKTIIYIDPYQVADGPKGDVILISHEHYDHFDPESLNRVKQLNALIIGPESVTSQLNEMAVTLEPNQSHTIDQLNIIIKAVPAYNTNKQFHPQAEGKLGYIIETAGWRLYHAGDTDIIPEMADLGNVDVALLPVSGTYVMTAEEAAEAITTIQPKVAIPMHYGAIIGSAADAERFAELVGDRCMVIQLKKSS